MEIDRTEIILTTKIPSPEVPWTGKLLVVRNGNVLFVPAALYEKGTTMPLHRKILAAAGLDRIRTDSPENMGGCYLKAFMGTISLRASSGDFGPIKKQAVVLPPLKAALTRFLLNANVAVDEIDTDALEA